MQTRAHQPMLPGESDASEQEKLTPLDRGLKNVPAARGATVPERRPRVDAMPDPEPRYGAGKISGCGRKEAAVRMGTAAKAQ